MFCAQPKSRLSVQRLSPSTQIPAWGIMFRNMYFSKLIFDIFSPCSGLIVSGFSKRPRGENIEKLKTYLDQVINPYKKFKKMYVVDNTTQEFTG